MALVSSLIVVRIDLAVPGWRVHAWLARLPATIDFNETLMRGMLCFLLFAGSLHLDIDGVLDNKWTIGLLSTVGLLISALVVGSATWWCFGLIGIHVSFIVCLVFGALISPTDPIAVMGLLKELAAPSSLEAQIAGESLFNDGVAVVVFFARLGRRTVRARRGAHADQCCGSGDLLPAGSVRRRHSRARIGIRLLSRVEKH